MGLSRSKLDQYKVTLTSWRAGVAATLVLAVAILFKAYAGKLSFFAATSGNEFAELGGVRLPGYSLMTSSFLVSILPLTIVGILLSLFAIRFVMTITRIRGSCSYQDRLTVAGGQEGAGAVEFVMLFPVLVVLLLMILQIALVVQAKFVVNYAAFCAARSAIVIIPDDFQGPRGRAESRNQIGGPRDSQKFEIIHRAAALPLTPISPLPGFSSARFETIFGNLEVREHLLISLLAFDVTPRTMMGQVVLRAPYAYDKKNTEVKVIGPQGDSGGSFKEHDFVTVRVTYRYYLTVPFVKKLFGTAYSGSPILNLFFGSDYYYPITEQYTLPMDGEPTVP